MLIDPDRKHLAQQALFLLFTFFFVAFLFFVFLSSFFFLFIFLLFFFLVFLFLYDTVRGIFFDFLGCSKENFPTPFYGSPCILFTYQYLYRFKTPNSTQRLLAASARHKRSNNRNNSVAFWCIMTIRLSHLALDR